MEAYSEPTKVLENAKKYVKEGEKYIEQSFYREAILSFEFALRSIRKLNLNDPTNAEVITEKEQKQHEAYCHQRMADAACSGRSIDAYTVLRYATYCLQIEPTNESALVSRIKAFLLPSIWQSKLRAIGDAVVLQEINPKHPFLTEFNNMKLPPTESDKTFGRKKQNSTSDDPEVQESLENQMKVHKLLIDSFSTNIHKAENWKKGMYQRGYVT